MPFISVNKTNNDSNTFVKKYFYRSRVEAFFDLLLWTFFCEIYSNESLHL